jgi:hypothetical protein
MVAKNELKIQIRIIEMNQETFLLKKKIKHFYTSIKKGGISRLEILLNLFEQPIHLPWDFRPGERNAPLTGLQPEITSSQSNAQLRFRVKALICFAFSQPRPEARGK